MKSIAVILLCGLLPLQNCNAQSLTDSLKASELSPQVAPEKLRFKVQAVKTYANGSKVEMDTTSGYQKFYRNDGQLVMEGKVVPAQPKGYREGIWNYYDEQGLLRTQETYKDSAKLRQLDFSYFENKRLLSETIQYFEGNYKDKASFKFIRIVVYFYMDGKRSSEFHSVNGENVYLVGWDREGKRKSMEILPPPVIPH